MTKAQPSPGSSFAKVDVAAAPERAAQLRHEFTNWLRMHFALDATKSSDMVLAVNEALANAAEFAYVSAQHPGVMHMRADYDSDSSTLTVTVADEGAWRAAEGKSDDPTRGRGIPLMRALTDRATIDPTPNGTEVRLQWDHIATVSSDTADGQNCGSRTT